VDQRVVTLLEERARLLDHLVGREVALDVESLGSERQRRGTADVEREAEERRASGARRQRGESDGEPERGETGGEPGGPPRVLRDLRGDPRNARQEAA
jgi:hypothetical protein